MFSLLGHSICQSKITSTASTNNKQIQSEDKSLLVSLDARLSQLRAEIDSAVQMGRALKQYQKQSIRKLDLPQAKVTRAKIQALMSHESDMRRMFFALTEQKNMDKAYEQTHLSMKQFEQYWDKTLKQYTELLRQADLDFLAEQEKQMKQLLCKYSEQNCLKTMKYSSKVLQLKQSFAALLKIKNYQQAQEHQIKIKKLQAVEGEEWASKLSQRRKLAVEQLQKRQNIDLQVFRRKIELSFSKKMREKDDDLQRILKKNRIRKIQSNRAVRQSLDRETVVSQFKS